MSRSTSISAVLLLIVVALASKTTADQQFHCPNSGLPKVDASGKPLQCLPGQAASEIVCGRGYSCYFSGFNYQCCPTAEEEEQHSEAECPQGSFSVLSANGSPLLCNPRTLQCPQDGMFCSSESSSISRGAICCEKIGQKKPSKKSEKAHQKLFASAQKIQFEERVTTLVNRDINEECPINALMVLSDESKPVLCAEDNPCPQNDMFCHSSITKESFCCQQMDTAKDTLSEDDTTQNPLKYSPDDAKKLVEELKIQEELEKAIVTQPKEEDLEVTVATAGPPSASPPTTTTEAQPAPVQQQEQQLQHPAGKLRYADNEAPIKNKEEELAEPKAKAQAVRTQVDQQQQLETDIEYKPHNQGGYAISRKLDKINSKKPSADHKLFAQQYLLEQIKNGWPYDEKFYRTEK
uniref:Uncharacterized protein n=1 Tax=Ditylenchus dipsaci TaxID=166011 RepID=A0A915CQP9_9BILA